MNIPIAVHTDCFIVKPANLPAMLGQRLVGRRLQCLLGAHPRCTTWPHKLRAATSSAAQHTDIVVQLPLCKRAAVHHDSLSNLLEWRRQVEAKIDSIGDAFELQDQGPSAADLRREVGWVLEDTVAEVQLNPEKPWEQCSWSQLQMEMAAARHRQRDTSNWQIKLRASVQQLHEWWKLRLEERVPFQYLISTAHWRTYIFSVAPGVLIPRPETEIFPESVEQVLRQQPELAALPWVDLGTGSGAIAISVADVLRNRNPSAQVLAVDISPVAAAHARANAEAAGLSKHVTVLEGSWLDPVLNHLKQTAAPANNHTQQPTPAAHASSSQPHSQASISHSCSGAAGTWPGPLLGGIVSNPPYIPRSVMESGLQAEVGQHEPWLALDGGPGAGLDSIEPICQAAAAVLTPGGFLMLETAGRDQAELVASRLRDNPAFKAVDVVLDCYGVNRFVTAHKA